jgi:hypothetical protein
VIVHDLDVDSGSAFPSKANALTIVDANRILAGTIATQDFESISLRHAKIFQSNGAVQEIEFAQRDPAKRDRKYRPSRLRVAASGKVLRACILELQGQYYRFPIIHASGMISRIRESGARACHPERSSSRLRRYAQGKRSRRTAATLPPLRCGSTPLAIARSAHHDSGVNAPLTMTVACTAPLTMTVA